MIVLGAFLGTFTAGGLQSFTFGVFFKPMTEAFGWSRGAMSAALTIRTMGGSLLGPFFGPIVDRHGPRYLMLACAIVGGVATLAVARITNLWQFYIVYGVAGAITLAGVGELVVGACVPKWFVRKRGRAVAVATMGNTIAGIVLVQVAQLVISRYGWQTGWLLLGSLFWALVVPVSFFMRRRPEDMGLTPDGEEAPAEQVQDPLPIRGGSAAVVEEQWALREAIRTPTLWLLILALNFGMTALVAVVVHEFSYITDRGFSSSFAAVVLSTHAAFAAVGRLIWGFAVERFPVRYCFALVFFGSAVGILVLLGVRSGEMKEMAFLFAAVYGLSVGGNATLTPVVWTNYFGRTFAGAIRGFVMPSQGRRCAEWGSLPRKGVLFDLGCQRLRRGLRNYLKTVPGGVQGAKPPLPRVWGCPPDMLLFPLSRTAGEGDTGGEGFEIDSQSCAPTNRKQTVCGAPPTCP